MSMQSYIFICQMYLNVLIDLIQQFIQADISQIEDTDNRLKCYMYAIPFNYTCQFIQNIMYSINIYSSKLI